MRFISYIIITLFVSIHAQAKLRVMATTTDMAAAVLYLASPSSGLVTGTVLGVDGGWTAR